MHSCTRELSSFQGLSIFASAPCASNVNSICKLLILDSVSYSVIGIYCIFEKKIRKISLNLIHLNYKQDFILLMKSICLKYLTCPLKVLIMTYFQIKIIWVKMFNCSWYFFLSYLAFKGDTFSYFSASNMFVLLRQIFCICVKALNLLYVSLVVINCTVKSKNIVNYFYVDLDILFRRS